MKKNTHPRTSRLKLLAGIAIPCAGLMTTTVTHAQSIESSSGSELCVTLGDDLRLEADSHVSPCKADPTAPVLASVEVEEEGSSSFASKIDSSLCVTLGDDLRLEADSRVYPCEADPTAPVLASAEVDEDVTAARGR